MCEAEYVRKKGTDRAGPGSGGSRAGLSLRFPAEHRKQGVPPRKVPEAWEFVKTDGSALRQHQPQLHGTSAISRKFSLPKRLG